MMSAPSSEVRDGAVTAWWRLPNCTTATRVEATPGGPRSVAYEAPFRCRTVASGSGPRSDRYHNLRAQPMGETTLRSGGCRKEAPPSEPGPVGHERCAPLHRFSGPGRRATEPAGRGAGEPTSSSPFAWTFAIPPKRRRAPWRAHRPSKRRTPWLRLRYPRVSPSAATTQVTPWRHHRHHYLNTFKTILPDAAPRRRSLGPTGGSTVRLAGSPHFCVRASTFVAGLP